MLVTGLLGIGLLVVPLLSGELAHARLPPARLCILLLVCCLGFWMQLTFAGASGEGDKPVTFGRAAWSATLSAAILAVLFGIVLTSW